MPSSYSTNLKIELQATGENSGTWGTVTNTNLGTALEQAIVGYGNPDYLSDANLTLTYTDTNSAQTARALVLNVTSALSLTGTRELVVPTIQKQYIVQNNTTGSQSITVKTSAGTGITIPNGRKAHLYVDGTNVIYMDDYVDINGGAIDGTPVGANSASTGAFSTLSATGNVNFDGGTFTFNDSGADKDFRVEGDTDANLLFSDASTDRIGIGTNTPASKLDVNGTITATAVNTTTLDLTNLEVTNIKAKDGTSAASIADSTGVVSFTANPILSGGTANGVLYLNGSKVATSGSALTFDGTNFGTTGNANLGSGSKSTDTQLNFASDLGTQRIYLDRGTRSLVFYDATTAIENYRIAGITGVQTWGVGGSEQMRLTSTGLGIGTSSPGGKLDVKQTTDTSLGGIYVRATDNNAAVISRLTTGNLVVRNGGIDSLFLDSSGNLGIGTSSPATLLDLGTSTGQKISVYRSATIRYGFGIETDTMRYYVPTGASNAVHSFGQISTTDGTTYTERMRLDSSGNLGLGVTPSAWGSIWKAQQLQVGAFIASQTNANDIIHVGTNAFANSSNAWTYINTAAATRYEQYQGAHKWFNAASGTAGNAISFTQAMTLDASGNLLVGTTLNNSYKAHICAGNSGNTVLNALAISNLSNSNGTGTGVRLIWKLSAFENAVESRKFAAIDAIGDSGNNNESIALRFFTQISASSGDPTERARITGGGNLLVGKTSVGFTAGVSVEAIGVVNSSRNGGPSGYFNRNTDDGTIVIFVQDGTDEGSISVSGNTVSYNAFAGSHWSQLQDGSKPDILRGTVMESINELCVWPDESNERLPKSKVSDTAGSKKVYGVFMAWDNDWTATNDMYVTAVGAFICRVNASVTVQEGDLLESNGDGTARVQADDIIRSSTIGKVTSTVKTHQYDDGSYCVPTVLYCG